MRIRSHGRRRRGMVRARQNESYGRSSRWYWSGHPGRSSTRKTVSGLLWLEDDLCCVRYRVSSPFSFSFHRGTATSRGRRSRSTASTALVASRSPVHVAVHVYDFSQRRSLCAHDLSRRLLGSARQNRGGVADRNYRCNVSDWPSRSWSCGSQS